MTATMNTKTKTRTNEQTAVSVQTEISQKILVAMGVGGAVVGLWAFASLIGGLVAAGGPIALVRSWFGALIGM